MVSLIALFYSLEKQTLICDRNVNVARYSAIRNGGGLVVQVSSSIALNGNSTFTDNKALHGGGMVIDSILVCSGNVEFDSNIAVGLGGDYLPFLVVLFH